MLIVCVSEVTTERVLFFFFLLKNKIKRLESRN
jgi:hypothetical protein